MEVYTSKEAVEAAGITYRQLDHWSNTGLVEAEVSQAEGKGSRRLFTFNNLLQMRVIKKLREAGIPWSSIRGFLEDASQNEEFDSKRYMFVSGGKSFRLDTESITQELAEDLQARGQGKQLSLVNGRNNDREVVIKASKVPAFKPRKDKHKKQA